MMSVFFGWALATFAEDQLKNARVQQAKDKHDVVLRAGFAERGLSYPPKNLLLVAYKSEAELEVWVDDPNQQLVLWKKVPICAASGGLGPKRRSGDGQVPEGIYRVSAFNPWSNYHLSLRVDYPNASDKKRGGKGANLGGDIMIHGDCVTIGCIPLQDDIQWVYWLAVQVQSGGGAIAVHSYPFRMDEATWAKAEARYPHSPHWPLWRELRDVAQELAKKRKIPHVRVGSDGAYVLE